MHLVLLSHYSLYKHLCLQIHECPIREYLGATELKTPDQSVGWIQMPNRESSPEAQGFPVGNVSLQPQFKLTHIQRGEQSQFDFQRSHKHS